MMDFDVSDWSPFVLAILNRESDIFEELINEIRTDADMMTNEGFAFYDLAVHGSGDDGSSVGWL
ncbi:Hypothetical protein MVR_LOCUS375 [uncultured virus]|nr:Hypothetical protein MVR_LOCUS375 [uncultured virus]